LCDVDAELESVLPGESLHILALEPYDGGSHRAFLDGWRERSRHRFTPFTLPAHSWKWRMRHAAVTFAAEAARLADAGMDAADPFDVIFSTDMLNLAEFRGLAPPAVAPLPAVCYFHENQLTYPVREERERDAHFGFSNMIAALAAEAVWFNSRFHRESFLEALAAFLARMPDRAPRSAVERIRQRSSVQAPGVEVPKRASQTAPDRERPLHLLWAARWEHDKNPEAFFAALRLLRALGTPFRLSVLGERFAEAPACFETAREEFTDAIVRWGYQPTRAAYFQALAEADVFVSTALHEFFGLSAVEAAGQGCVPALPRRLAYPEVFADERGAPIEGFFYGESAENLAAHVQRLSALRGDAAAWAELVNAAQQCGQRYEWERRAAALDDAIARVTETGRLEG
jgi:glycosyltransferase involved in cell wall biosynthesis